MCRIIKVEKKVRTNPVVFVALLVAMCSSFDYAQTNRYVKDGVFYIENGLNNFKKGKRLVRKFAIGENEKGVKYLFYNFLAFTVDDAGCIYVIDGHKNIRKYDKNGKYLLSFGKDGEGPGEFRSATKILHKNKFIYLLDNKLFRLTKYSTSGKYISSIKMSKLAIDFVVTNDDKYIIHIEDMNANYKLIKCNQKGDILLSFGNKEPFNHFLENHFFNTGMLAIDASDNFYLSHLQPYKIEKYDKNGKLIGVISRKVNYPIVKPLKPNITKKGETMSFFVRGENNARPTKIPIDICVFNNKIYHVVEKNNNNTGSRTCSIDIYSLEGSYLQEIILETAVVGVQCLSDRIIILEENPFKQDTIPIIVVYNQLIVQ